MVVMVEDQDGVMGCHGDWSHFTRDHAVCQINGPAPFQLGARYTSLTLWDGGVADARGRTSQETGRRDGSQCWKHSVCMPTCSYRSCVVDLPRIRCLLAERRMLHRQ